MKRTGIIPFPIFLLPLFFVWHVQNDYFGLIELSYPLKFLFYYWILAAVLYLLARLLLKDPTNAGCLTSLALIIFFFWGSAHDTLRKWHLPDFLTSYLFLFSFLILIMTAWAIRMKRKKKPSTRFYTFLLYLFSTFVIYECIVSMYKLSTNQLQKNNLAYYNEREDLHTGQQNPLKRPDIFYIIFDEYASSAALRKYLNYDNSKLDSVLAKRDFFISTKSKSNYNSTPHSIGSTFNLNYFKLPLENSNLSSQDYFKAQYSVKKALISEFLHKEGYAIKNYGFFDIPYAKAPVESIFSWDAWTVFYYETLAGRIEKEIWWNVAVRVPWLTIRRMRPKEEKILRYNKSNYKGLINELEEQSATPKFVYGHLQLPHSPFFVDSLGNLNDRNLFYSMEQGQQDSLYLGQLKFANRLIDTISVAATKTFSRPRVIIIAGDHGYRRRVATATSVTREQQLMNLEAYYFSDRDYRLLYDSISPVNSFRVILNKYFEARLSLLKDSLVVIRPD